MNPHPSSHLQREARSTAKRSTAQRSIAKRSTAQRSILLLLTSAIILLLSSCALTPRPVTVEGAYIEVTAAADSLPQNAEAQAILAEYRQRVIDVQAPVLGTASFDIDRGRPEGLMNNFMADVLRAAGDAADGKPIDVAIANYGGIRNLWQKGDITVGDVYRAFPFENCLALATLTGEQLTNLFQAIARVGGQPISGAALVITPDGELVTCDVQGHPVNPTARYRVATLDYLVEGNDGMDAFREATDVTIYSELTIRSLITARIEALTANGQPIAPVLDGRITLINLP